MPILSQACSLPSGDSPPKPNRKCFIDSPPIPAISTCNPSTNSSMLTAVSTSCSEFDQPAQLRPGGGGQIGFVLLRRDVGGQRAEQASDRRQQSRDALAVHAVDPAVRAQGLDADRYRRTAADLRGGFPAADRRGHGEIEPSVLGRRQGGVRDIAIEALLLALLRAGRGHHQVAELGCAAWMRWRTRDRSRHACPAGRR